MENVEQKAKRCKIDSILPEKDNEVPIILQVILWHEEGVWTRFFEYALPLELPTDLPKSLEFLRDVHAGKELATNKEEDFYKGKENEQFMYCWRCPEDVDLFDSEDSFNSISFITHIEQVCGKPVIGRCGKRVTVLVPTFE